MTHGPPRAVKGRLVAEGFSQGSLPRCQLCRDGTAASGALCHRWPCPRESIAGIVPGKVTLARHAGCSEHGGCAGTAAMGKGKGQRAEGDEGVQGAGTKLGEGLGCLLLWGRFCVCTQRGAGPFPQR